VIKMPIFEKYCDKCGEPSTQLKNVNGKMLCPKCRGLPVKEEEKVSRKERLRKMWLAK
jgi:formylmethanofuran dehydrogenase subunit E